MYRAKVISRVIIHDVHLIDYESPVAWHNLTKMHLAIPSRHEFLTGSSIGANGQYPRVGWEICQIV